MTCAPFTGCSSRAVCLRLDPNDEALVRRISKAFFTSAGALIGRWEAVLPDHLSYFTTEPDRVVRPHRVRGLGVHQNQGSKLEISWLEKALVAACSCSATGCALESTSPTLENSLRSLRSQGGRFG